MASGRMTRLRSLVCLCSYSRRRCWRATSRRDVRHDLTLRRLCATSDCSGLHRVRRVRANDADVVIEERGVDRGDFDLGHVAGDAVGFGLGADFWRRVLVRLTDWRRGAALAKICR